MSSNKTPPTNSWIRQAIYDLSLTLDGKNEDYRIDGEFSNFEYAADVSGVTTIQVMMSQLGIKIGRLTGLSDNPNNESFKDSVKDLAGYAVILYAYLMSESEDEVEENCYCDSCKSCRSEDEVWVLGPNSEEEF